MLYLARWIETLFINLFFPFLVTYSHLHLHEARNWKSILAVLLNFKCNSWFYSFGLVLNLIPFLKFFELQRFFWVHWYTHILKWDDMNLILHVPMLKYFGGVWFVFLNNHFQFLNTCTKQALCFSKQTEMVLPKWYL